MSLSEEIQKLTDAGFSSAEITSWRDQKTSSLLEAGFSEEEVMESLGAKTPDFSKLEENIKTNINAAQVEGKPLGFFEALEYGTQMSVPKLALRGKMPDKSPTGGESTISKAAITVGQMAYDSPIMVAGGILGGTGGPVTAMSGAFGLPEGLRATLIDGYENGDFKSFGDFWDRASGIILKTVKAQATGAATAATGLAAAPIASKVLPSVLAAPATELAEVAAMTTVGAALEGEVPTWDQFQDAGIAIMFYKGAVKGAVGVSKGVSKLAKLYKNTGVKPEQVVSDSFTNPTIVQDLASEAPVVKAYQPQEKASVADVYKTPAGEEAVSQVAGDVNPKGGDSQGDAGKSKSQHTGSAQSRVLERISTDTPVKKETGSVLRQTYTDYVDDLHPIKIITKQMTEGQDLPAMDNPYILARLSRGASGRAESFLENGPFDFNTFKTVAPSFKEIVGKHKGDLDGFRAYLVSKRVADLEGRGIKTGVDAKDAAEVVNGGKKYEAAAKDLEKYQTATLKFLKDSGILSEKSYNEMLKTNKDYVPFYRIMEEESISGVAFGKKITVWNPIKKIKGSEKGIIDPLESIVKNTFSLVDLAGKNEVYKSFYELASNTKDPSIFFEKVKTPVKPVEIGPDEVSRFLKKEGIEGDPQEVMTVFRGVRQPLAKDEIAFFDKGERIVLKVDPEVATAFKTVGNRESASLLVQLLAKPASLLRVGATLTPEFAIKNIQRDQLTAFVNSNGRVIPFFSFGKGLSETIGRGEQYNNWLKGGGAHGTLVSLDRNYIQNSLYKLLGENPEANFLDKTWNVVKKPVDVLRAVSEISEEATRIGGFLREKPQTKAEILDAAFKSRELTLDFQRMGAKVKALNMITAFLNVGIQGPDKIARTFKDNPLGTLATVAVSTTIPSALLWWANHEDDRYKELPAWQRDLFWIVPTKDHLYRIPKPFETGIIFGSGMERMLDAVTEGMDKRELDQYMGSVIGGFTPNFMPTFATPILEQMTNYSFFGGHNLIPYNMESILPEYQYKEYTSELTKAVAKAVGFVTQSSFANPIIIDNYLRSWTGGLGNYVLGAADAALRKTGVLPDPVMPTSTLSDLPVIKAFVVRYPSATAESIQRFRDDYEQKSKVYNTFKMLAQNGDTDAALKVIEGNPTAMFKLDSINQTLSEHTALIRLIQKNQEITPDEKRQLIDSTYMNMIEMSKAGNEMMKAVDEQ